MPKISQTVPSTISPRVEKSPDVLNAKKLVYCIYDGSALKIGETTKHPKQRLDELQVGNPRKLVLLAYTSHIGEKQAHSYLGSCHLRGEWFCIAVYSLSYVSKFDWVDKAMMKELMSECMTTGW